MAKLDRKLAWFWFLIVDVRLEGLMEKMRKYCSKERTRQRTREMKKKEKETGERKKKKKVGEEREDKVAHIITFGPHIDQKFTILPLSDGFQKLKTPFWCFQFSAL